MYLEKVIVTKQELDSLRPFEKGLEERVMQKLRLDWNYHSNSIEGNSLTYGETKSLILHHITAQGKPLRDHFEITGHNEALLWIEDLVKGERKLSENFVRELHTLILKENYFKKAVTPEGETTQKEIKVGEYKTTQNHVITSTGEVFRFSEPHEVNAKMTDLLNWYNSKIEDKTLNPIILAAEFHYKFILIHPFDDGNGRVARILMNFILMKFGYHPAIIKKENKEEYYKGLRLADGNNIEPFIEFIAESVNESLTLMLNAIKGLPFEDENDIDKQFWLLEQKLKDISLKEEKDRLNKKHINDFINNIIGKVVEECDLQNQRFDQYYESIEKHEDEEFHNKYIFRNNNEVISYNLGYLFEKFKYGIENKNYLYSLTLSFDETGFLIKNSNSILYSSTFDKQLAYDEIKKCISVLTLEHIKFIDQQISTNK